MTEEQITEVAKQAGFWKPLGLPSDWYEDDYVVTPLELRDFIKLVKNETIEWVASWYEHGKQKFKYFPIKDYSSSEEAFKAAVEYRQRMIELYCN